MMQKRNEKRILVAVLGLVLCTGIVGPYIQGERVDAADTTEYIINLPADSQVTNDETQNGSMQFIDISFQDQAVGTALKDAVSVYKMVGEQEREKLNLTYFSVSDRVRVPVSNLSSNDTYTLKVEPKGYSNKEVKFTTGTIVEDTNVSSGLQIIKKSNYSMMNLLRGYDLDSVTVKMDDYSGANVYLTRDIKEKFDDMTCLGTMTQSEQTFTLTDYQIGKYQYIIVKSMDNVSKIDAYVGKDSIKGIKARPIGGDDVDLRFTAFSDAHIQINQRDFRNITNILSKSKSEKFGGGIDALVMVGDIFYMFSNPEYKAEMLKRYTRLKTMLTENGYGYNNVDNDTDDIIPTIYAAGNHEYALTSDEKKTGDDSRHKEMFIDQVGSLHSHKVINGYHFIAASADYDAKMTADAATWTKAEIEKALAEDMTGTKPIFVFAHSRAIKGDDFYNTDYYNSQEAKDLIRWMQNYPQIVLFSGHEHSAMQQQTCMVQSGFSQVMLGLTAGGNLEYDTNGVSTKKNEHYTDISTNVKKYIDEEDLHPQGVIVEVKNNVVYVYAIDFYTGEQIGEPWVIDTEGLVTQEAREYYTDVRYEYSVAPEFAEDAALTITTQTTKDENEIYSMTATATFPQASCAGIYGDKAPLMYQTYIYDAETGSRVAECGELTDYVFGFNNMKDTASVSLPSDLAMGRTYRIDVHGVNSFGKLGKPISKIVTMTPEGYVEAETQCSATVIINEDYSTQTDGYKFFANDTNGNNVTISDTHSAYSMEVQFHTPMSQTGRLVGTDDHNLSLRNNKLVFTYKIGETVKELSTTRFYLNTSVHVVASCNSTDAKLYVDGFLVAKETFTEGTVSLSGSAVIGKDVLASVRKVNIYSRALTDAEVRYLAEQDNTQNVVWIKQIPIVSVTSNVTRFYDGLVLDKLVDGNIGNYTALYGGEDGTQKIYVNLGKVYDVRTMILYRRSGGASDVQGLQIAAGSSIEEATVLLTDTGGNNLVAGANYLTPENTSVQHIILSRNNNGLLVLNEFMVFGKEVGTP